MCLTRKTIRFPPKQMNSGEILQRPYVSPLYEKKDGFSLFLGQNAIEDHAIKIYPFLFQVFFYRMVYGTL